MNPSAIFTLVKTSVQLLMHALGIEGDDVEKSLLGIPVLGRLFWLIWMPIKGLLIAFGYLTIAAICGFLILAALLFVAGPLELLIEWIMENDQYHQEHTGVVWSLTFAFWGIVLGWSWLRRRRARAAADAPAQDGGAAPG